MNLNLYLHSSRYSFLCPNGTLFQQQYFICDWWFNVDCSLVNLSNLFIAGEDQNIGRKAEDFYRRNIDVIVILIVIDVIFAGGGFLREERWSCCGAGCKLWRQWQRAWTIRSRVNLGGKCETRSKIESRTIGSWVNRADQVKSPYELFWHILELPQLDVNHIYCIFKPGSVFSTLNTLIGYRKISFCISKGLLQISVLESMKKYLKY